MDFRIIPGQKVTAGWANELLETLRRCRITSVVGGRLTRNAGGGTTLEVSRTRAAPEKGDADAGEPEAKSVEKDKKGRWLSLFEFLKPSEYAAPSVDRARHQVLVRDGSGEVPALRYMGLDQLAAAGLPAGVYDKDTLLWNLAEKKWEPKRTAVVNVVVALEKYGAVVRMRRQNVRVALEDENPGGWETVFTGEECAGLYG
jgi:hypothetical protein